MPSSQQADLSAMARCNCVSLRKAARRISLHYDGCLAPAGLRATQFSMLAVLAARQPLSVHALAAMLDMDRSTAGQNVKLLARDGLMEIVSDARDRRVRALRLTAQGQARLEAARPLWQQAQHTFETLNGSAQAAKMRAMLQNMKITPAAQSRQGEGGDVG